MIKINIYNISNWDGIKENHIKFIKQIIEDEYKDSNKEPKEISMNQLPSKVRRFIKKNIYSIFIGERVSMLASANKLRRMVFKGINDYELEILDKFYYGNKQLKEKIINEIQENFLSSEYDFAREKFISNMNKEKIRLYEKDKENFIDNNYKKYRKGLKINKILSNLFSYKKLVDGKDGWDRHKLISSINIDVCPYCNRQYISTYKENNKRKTTADLDHFYPKSIYPILALSLYNFIPSCQLCNSRLKLNKDFRLEEHIYPYEECFDDYGYYFTTYPNLKGGIDYLRAESNQFDLKIECRNMDLNSVEKVENSKKTFKLEELYSNHKDYASEIMKKANLYNDDRISIIFDEFEDLFESREEIIRLIFSNYINKDDLHRRPLSKLTKDICNEFGIMID